MSRVIRTAFVSASSIALLMLQSPAGYSEDPEPPPGFAILDYTEAEQRGIDVSVPEGMPLCDLNPDWPGYETAEAAAEAAEQADRAPECAADPRLAEYVVGAPVPHANHGADPYMHNGYDTTNQNFEGGRGELEVRDIQDIPHQSGNLTRFVVGRFLIGKPVSTSTCAGTVKWGEAGWSEVSWSNNDQRRVYSWGTADCTWRFYDQQYNLQDGSYYTWRVQEMNNDLGTSILWNGQWQSLHTYNVDCSPNDCTTELMVEVFSSINGEHPDWGGGVDVRAVDVKQSGNWGSWNGSYPSDPFEESPYRLCDVSQFTQWYVTSNSGC